MEKPILLVIGHSFVRRMHHVCQVGEVGGERHRYYRRDLDLADMFGKVVFRGKGGLTVDRLFRELRAVWVIAPTVVLVDIGTNDLGNGCVPEDLAERIVAFARELLTIVNTLIKLYIYLLMIIIFLLIIIIK